MIHSDQIQSSNKSNYGRVGQKRGKKKKLKKNGPKEVERNAQEGVSFDAEDSIRVLEPPKDQLEQGRSFSTPLNPCNLRFGSCIEIMFKLSVVIILYSAILHV